MNLLLQAIEVIIGNIAVLPLVPSVSAGILLFGLERCNLYFTSDEYLHDE